VADGVPPELPLDHPFIVLAERLAGQGATTAPYGTDASQLQAIAPCIVLGPGDTAQAHTPTEWVAAAELEAAVDLFGRLLASGSATA
jgi:acetylornithine deacetylase/succinyl-diaminopimelate desuccinylase-like protein